MQNKQNDDFENRRARAIALLRAWEYEMGKEDIEKPVNERETNLEYNDMESIDE